MARGNYQDALKHAAVVTNTAGFRAQGLILAAQIYGRTNAPERAMQLIADADREIARGNLGKIPLLEYTRGDTLARLNRFEEAEVALRAGIRDFPEDREAWASLAVIDWLRGNQNGARTTMEQYVRANPTPAAREFAAKTFRELGDDRIARSFAGGSR
jgi:Flp pilus assembly protein TadD